MERRKFIALTGVGVGLCVIPPSLYYIAPGVKEYATLILKKELSYLHILPGSIETYVDDYFNATSNDTVSALKWKILYYMKANCFHVIKNLPF